jgi:uncharacterized protein (DUF2236 family)
VRGDNTLSPKPAKTMTVTRAELERFIAALSAEVTDPRAGIYGPASASWCINRESILFLGGGKAALLQLAHPFVAHGVDQHSLTRTDPLGRFQRTFDNVFAMVFGDLESAIKSSRRVHAIHSRVNGVIDERVGALAQGSRYEANDESALMWVHATLLATAVEMHELLVRPLSREEKCEYYEESKRFARLFGIPDRVLPADWNAFDDYYRRMLDSDVIRVGRPARELAGFLFASPKPWLKPLFGWLEVMTAGFLPPRLRGDFGFEYGPLERVVFDASVAAIRPSYARLPARLRHSPAYIAACRRLAGKAGPDRVAQWLERLALSVIETKQRPGRRRLAAA